MLRQLIRRHRSSLALVGVLAGIGGGASVTLIITINRLAASPAGGDDLKLILRGLTCLAVLLIAGALSQFRLARLGADLVADLRVHLARCLLSFDYERLAHRKHLVMNSVSEDIGRMGPLVLLAPQLAYSALLVILCGGYLISLSAPLFALLCAFHSPALVLGWITGQRTQARFNAMRAGDDKVFEYFRALRDGKKELALSQHRTRHFAEGLLRPSIKYARDRMYRMHLAWGLSGSVSTTLTYGAIFGVIVIGRDMMGVSTGTIVQMVLGGLFLAGPINILFHAAPQVALGRASLRRLQDLGIDLDTPIETPLSPAPAADERDWQYLRARELSYHYPAEVTGEQSRGVGPIDLELRRGEMVFITGGNGSGKSTLLLLLCALLRPSAGTLELDGHSVWDEPSPYRNRFGTIFGDFFVFTHVLDVEGNLLDDAQIDTLLRRLGLYPQVSARAGELSKVNLSTGQRKRLALLQCYAQDRDVIVLDEWAADQDPHFREYFYHVLLPELKQQGKTLLVISHDDRYFHLADRLITLEDGLVRADTVMQPDAARPESDQSGGRAFA